MSTAYYILDLLVGYGFPIALWAAIRTGRVAHSRWRLLWCGAAIGLLWEVPIFALSGSPEASLIRWIEPPPVHPAFFLVAHSLWDGMLLLLGFELARRITRARDQPATGPLGVVIMVLWGQATALAVELSAIGAGTWSYVGGHAWNPTLFHAGEHPVTLAMQVVWLAASLGFVAVVRAVLGKTVSRE